MTPRLFHRNPQHLSPPPGSWKTHSPPDAEPCPTQNVLDLNSHLMDYKGNSMPGSYRAKYESCQFTETSRWGNNMTRAQERGIRTRHLWVKPWRGGWGLVGRRKKRSRQTSLCSLLCFILSTLSGPQHLIPN